MTPTSLIALAAAAGSLLDMQGTPPNVPKLLMDTDAYMLFAYPPCNTPEAAKAKACVKWKLEPDNPRAIGYLPPALSLPASAKLKDPTK